ncbi:MAG: orotidine-5'-phosphate decarboxylase [Atopobiaceae bacterium]|jgi:orotidine-5'-phosphate decarboxylase|nr:orotidine-5'-phosphate decarboxylase [Atopobiaceae bacterium]
MLDIPASERIIVALDCDHGRAVELAGLLKGRATWLKVGMTLYYASGPAIVEYLKDLGFKVFLDLKLHDIPHQVRGAAESASLTGADLLSVHSLGGADMVRAAREGVQAAALERGVRTKLVAITVLTSMDAESLAQVGIERPVGEEVASLAGLSHEAGVDGVVCSPREAAAMRSALGPKALVVTPGVRPAGSEVADQRRIATPAEAVAAGASHIVVGRPITQSDDPAAAFSAIAHQVEASPRPGA